MSSVAVTNRLRWWLALGVFGVAMGALEGIVVVYLRELYYPNGFSFPLAPMPRGIYAAEIVREFCTIFMLGGLAALAARGFLRQFAVFLWSFAIWDVVYYITLKLALDWPNSWLEWDILFLIPIPWVGPVLAPLLYCAAMCAVGWSAWRLAETGSRLGARDIALLALSAALVMGSFMEEPFRLISRVVADEPDRSRHADLVTAAFQAYIPQRFNWPLFGVGLFAGFAAAWRMSARAAAARPRSADSLASEQDATPKL
jgi:hypothetical protein